MGQVKVKWGKVMVDEVTFRQKLSDAREKSIKKKLRNRPKIVR